MRVDNTKKGGQSQIKMEAKLVVSAMCIGTLFAGVYVYENIKLKEPEQVKLYPKKSLEPISNQLVRVSKAKEGVEIVKESNKLIEMALAYGPPLSNSTEIYHIQDAVNLNGYVVTRYGPIFNTDPTMPKMEFRDPVPTDKLRGYNGSYQHIYYSAILSDFGTLLKRYEAGLIKE